MSSQTPRRAATFQTIDADECMTLLEGHQIGRIAFPGEDGILVFPVNHVVHGGDIYFRTSPYALVVEKLQHGGKVSFEVDDVDEYLRAGWSVLVMGSADLLDPHEALETLPATGHPDPWAGGARTVTVRIRPSRITGRRVLPD
jgi:hypothetical protein